MLLGAHQRKTGTSYNTSWITYSLINGYTVWHTIHSPRSKFRSYKNIYKKHKHSDMEKKHTVILLYRSETSFWCIELKDLLKNCLGYFIFFFLTYHTLPLVHDLLYICSIEKSSHSELTKIILQNKMTVTLVASLMSFQWLSCYDFMLLKILKRLFRWL